MAESPRIIELQQKFEDNPRRYFASLANEYRKAGDLQRAISICRIYLEKQPSHTPGQVVLGQALYATGNLEEAGEAFRKVLELDPENLIALKCLGDIAHNAGDLDKAHENFRKVLTADPRDHDTSGKLKSVEQALKLAANAPAEEWIPPRSDEFAIPDAPPPVFARESTPEPADPGPVEEPSPAEEPSIEEVYDPGDLPQAAPDDSPPQSLEVDDLPALEPPATHEDIPEDDFVDTLLPGSEEDHHAGIAEPVALESAEDSLAVSDLMEEADIPPTPPSADDDDQYQYRTAEYSLPSYSSTDLDAAETSAEMESEAEALLSEVEGDSPAASEFADHTASPNIARTGEYSLSRDTDEWNLNSAEAESHPSAPVEEVGGVEPAGPFITETVAELYLQQGFTGEALLVYRQLARSKPGDQRIADRIAELEQRLAQEHEVRQAALESPSEMEVEVEVDLEPRSADAELVSLEPEPAPQEIPFISSVVFNDTRDDFPEPAGGSPVPPPPPAPVAAVDDLDDWFASAPVPPPRSRQTVQEFFAVLGRAKPEIRRKPKRARVSADDIRAAANITAGFGAFGMEPSTPAPKPIPAATPGEETPQNDVRRFRAWLDGLSDS